ncbi:MAG: protein kinase [Alphaproteobacteria bacterium]|nr:protein kinase [Alphaproteobacteria bacterium]MCB9691371.1 protein kinase [Alphaproteobacteria bacterium]
MTDDATAPVREALYDPRIVHPRYEDRGALGSGGSGDVRRVFDRDLDREVALKVLRRGTPEELLAEARVAARLRHPSLVPVFDAAALDDGRWYFTMPLVCGDTFDVALGARTLPERVELVASVTDVVAHAHREALAHLDLKPSNVLVDTDGRPQVLDWGLAQAVGTSARSSRGTPRYLAPERTHSTPFDPARADVYALGALLFQALVGSPPFEGLDGVATLHALRAGITPEVPDAPDSLQELADLARRCLSPDPTARPGDAGALASELRVAARALTGAGIARTDLFDALDRALGSGRSAVLAGPAGIGKSHALQGWLLSRSWSRYARRAVVEVHGGRPRQMLEARIADALGLELRGIPLAETLAELGPVLIAVESVEAGDPGLHDWLQDLLDQVPTLHVVKTTRHRESHAIDVGPLGREEATRLLAHHSGMAAGDDLSDLAASLDHHPLSLVLAGPRVRLLGIGAVASDVARDPALEASILASWMLLPAPERALWVDLTAFADRFTPADARALHGRTDTLALLAALAERSLVQRDGDDFRLLAAIRAFAAARAPDDLPARHARWAAQSAEALVPDVRRFAGSAPRKALRTLATDLRLAVERVGDAELAARCLAAWLEHVRMSGPHDAVEPVTRTVLRRPDVPQALRARCAVLVMECQWDQRMDTPWTRDALNIARAHGNPDLLARALARQALVAMWDKRVDTSFELLAEAEDLLEPDAAALCTVWRVRFSCLLSQRRSDEAEALATRGLSLARALDDRESQLRALIQSGLVANDLNRSHEAKRHFEEALGIALDVGSGVDIGRLHNLIATVHQDAGRVDLALSHGRAAVEHLVAAGSRIWLGLALSNLANAQRVAGDLPAARRTLERAIHLKRLTGMRVSAAISEGNLGCVFQDEGDLDAAVACWVHTVSEAAAMGDARLEGAFRIKIAEVALDRGDAGTALAEAESALALVEPTGAVVFAGLARIVVGRAAWRLGSGERARTELARVQDRFAALGLPPDAEPSVRLAVLADELSG